MSGVIDDKWNELDSKEPTDKFVDAVKEYVRLTTIIESAKEQLDGVKEGLLSEFPNDFGEYEKVAGKYRVKVSRGERHSWDGDKLEKIFGAHLPSYIKRNYKIDKRVLDKLDPSERDQLLDALTRKPGLTSIEVDVI